MADGLQSATGTNRELLDARHYDAFALRIMGLTYDKIAKKLSLHPVTVRAWFAKSGVLYNFWRDWVAEHKRDALEETMDMMWGHLPDIMRANISDARRQDSMVGILARKFIFEHTLGKPEDRLRINGAIATMSFTEWMQAQTNKLKTEDGGHATATSQEVSSGADSVSN